MTELSLLVDLMNITDNVYMEALRLCNESKHDQIVYIWNITKDSYDYVICDSEDAIPDVVQKPYTTRLFAYEEDTHE